MVVANPVNRHEPNAGISAASVWNAGNLRVNALNVPNAKELFTVAAVNVLGVVLARPHAIATDAGIAFVMPMNASVPFYGASHAGVFAKVTLSMPQLRPLPKMASSIQKQTRGDSTSKGFSWVN